MGVLDIIYTNVYKLIHRAASELLSKLDHVCTFWTVCTFCVRPLLLLHGGPWNFTNEIARYGSMFRRNEMTKNCTPSKSKVNKWFWHIYREVVLKNSRWCLINTDPSYERLRLSIPSAPTSSAAVSVFLPQHSKKTIGSIMYRNVFISRGNMDS